MGASPSTFLLPSMRQLPLSWFAGQRQGRGLGESNLAESDALPERISVLASGQEWRTSWDHARARSSTDLPDHHSGAVGYRGIDGAQREFPVALDWSLYRMRRWVTVWSVHHGAEALREMRRIMEKWTDSPRGGLAAFIRDGDAADAPKREQFQAWKASQSETIDRA